MRDSPVTERVRRHAPPLRACGDRDAASQDDSMTASDAGDGEPDDARRSPISNNLPTRQKTTKRSTYDVRRKTKADLLRQMQELQSQLDALEERQCGDDAFDLQRSRLHLRQLQKGLHTQNLQLAGVQSLLSSFRGTTTWRSPLATYIHLPREMDQRRRVLTGLYDDHIAVATAFMRERTNFLDLRSEHCHFESFELENGEFVFTRFDVTPFGSDVSVRRVHDELLQHLNDHEISISESLGMITIVAAETEGATPFVRQNCLLSTLDDGLDLESNSVLFSQFVDAADGTEYGMSSVDFIDQDDLLAGSSTRLRKDISACSLVAAFLSPMEGARPVVYMARWSSLRLHTPPVPLTREQAVSVRKHIRAWPDVMLDVIQQRLALR